MPEKFPKYINLQLGIWNIQVIAYTRDAKSLIRILKKNSEPFLIKGQIKTPDHRLLIIHSTDKENPEQILSDLVGYYSFPFRTGYRSRYNNQIVFSESDQVSIFEFKGDPSCSAYRGLLGYILFQALKGHVENNGLCLHSCGVCWRENGYLFLGASDAGKTTIAGISSEIGRIPLGDDLNFIYRNDSCYNIASAPSPIISPFGYSRKRPRLRGLFHLVKDSYDKLISIKPIKLMQLLYDAYYMQTPYTNRLGEQSTKSVFHMLGNIARDIPAYELHFRKSPDFWKLIDAEFPD